MVADISGLVVDNLHKYYGEALALAGVSFEVQRGNIVAVLGPSGCGKSTLLAIIAGLLPPDLGRVSWNDISLGDVPPHKRNFGLMFQDLALFPHRDVFHNVAFGLQMARMPKDNIRKRVQETLELVGLPGFEHRDVNTLSGGESQRIALARSLAPHPRLLMLDEPLGSLDRNLRERLVIDLRRILQDSQQTAIYVTHDQEEAFTIADRIVVMNAGAIEQIGSPQAIYQKPANPFVARFLGLDNLISGSIPPNATERLVSTSIGTFPIYSDCTGSVTVLIRPDRAELNSKGDYKIHGVLRGTTFRGDTLRVLVQVDSTYLRFDFPSDTALPEIGKTITISIDPQKAFQIFPKEADA